MALYINYGIMAIGIIILVIAVTIIFLDKLKGEDLYFNMDMKEQQLKKVMEDADELIDELNDTSELVISDMEKKYGDIKVSCEVLAQEARKQLNAANALPSVERSVHKYGQADMKLMQTKKTSKFVNDEEVVEKKKLSTRQLAVIEMSSRGMTVTEIAREMNMGQGEVSLILSLRNED